MERFETYFEEKEIVAYLCKLRSKVAKSRNKKHLLHVLTSSEKYNYHLNDLKKYSNDKEESVSDFDKYQGNFLAELNCMFPSRKNWIKLGKQSRTDKITGQPISSNDRNYFSLIKTIQSYREKSPNEPWLVELDTFIQDVRKSAFNRKYSISKPVIFPKLKDKIKRSEANKCRPISLFSLKDRVILSLTNKYLTRLFDGYFKDCSYAFRSKKNKENNATLTHHDCIKDLKEYRKLHEHEKLWVVECDMEKFYDSVNHKIINRLYEKLVREVKNNNPSVDLSKPSNIFKKFLKCYCFNHDILPLNSNSEFWAKYKIHKGEFGWILDQIEELGLYDCIESERIGIPQGGALSGLIANIVLNVADAKVLKTKVFYVRFCDDMLMLHPVLNECVKAKKAYVEALKRLKLVPHKFCEGLSMVRKNQCQKLPQTTIKLFWHKKSKGPYQWTSLGNGGYPWIGFVGYELHFNGMIRVRKRSIQKELNKQKEMINEIKKAISEEMRRSVGYITESAIHRLVGMSVGRVNLRNYNTVSNDLCWKNGFKELTLNPHSVRQIKQLDRNRNKLYYALERDLKKVVGENKTEEKSAKQRQIVDFDKPFSYYYQVLERKKNEKATDNS